MKNENNYRFNILGPMVFEVLAVISLLVLARTGYIPRTDSYWYAFGLLLLAVPFHRDSLEVNEEGLSIRHCLIPRRRKLAWGELATLTYHYNPGTSDNARLILQTRTGRRYRMTIRIPESDRPEAFPAFLTLARTKLTPDAVIQKTTWFDRVFY